MGKVAVLGSINHDVIVTCDRAPRAGETVHGSAVSFYPGGKGSNQAIAAARFGADVSFFGRVGKDSAGLSLLSNLDDDGVNRRYVRISDSLPTGTALITVDRAGSNSIVVVSGANSSMGSSDVAELTDAGCGPNDVLVCQLEIPRETVAEALNAGHELGMTTILNAAPADDVRDLLAVVDVFVVNEREIVPNIGGEFSSRSELTERIAELSAAYQCSTIVTLGAEGCVAALYIDGAISTLDLEVPDVEVVDGTGAGDTFVGVLAACIAAGTDPRESVSLAGIAGSLSTTRKGAQDAMPTRSQVEAFMA